MTQTPFQDGHSHGNGRVDDGENPSSDQNMRQVHPIEASSVAPPTRGHLHPSHANGSSLYAHSLPPYWVIPVVTESIIPLLPHVYVTPSSTAPVPPPPPPPPSTQTPAHDHRSGTQKRTQKEKDLIQLEQEIISSPWYAANDLEPPCGSPSCPYSADCYGVRGMSCYTAFVIAQPVGTFGCWHCPAYSTRKLEDAVKHQRSNHFNHKPFLCTPTNGTVCGKRYFSQTDLRNHRRRCH